ncbi:hypothetical protein M231_03321 [Tremella mesenterica]|uniref:Uncharacterized protein n=1 Tax=Tremella mesenterica TaxID=5217 RepID=A0A4Q1BND7_TREME|nr:hypothetical protein M231_03321 [Tremella mesenterica]
MSQTAASSAFPDVDKFTGPSIKGTGTLLVDFTIGFPPKSHGQLTCQICSFFCPTFSEVDRTFPTWPSLDAIIRSDATMMRQLGMSLKSRWHSFGNRLRASVCRGKSDSVEYATYQLQVSLVEQLSKYVLENTKRQGEAFQMVDIKLVDRDELYRLYDLGRGAVLEPFGQDVAPTFSWGITAMDEGRARR